jgi:hypothetical protein
MEAMSMKSQIAMLVLAAVIAVAPAAGHAQDEEALESQLAAVQPKVCQAQPQLCRELQAFVDAVTPCVPEGERLTVGHAYLIEDDGTARPAEYFVVRTQRLGETTLVQTQHVYSENEEEKQAAEALIAAIGSGSLDQANPLYRYLAGSGGQIPQLLAQPQGRSLVVRAGGPVIYLRQAGKRIYSVMPDTVVTRPGGGQPQGGMLFAVLPALAACE